MIKKLKRTFILINMLCVFAVLLAVFCVIYSSNRRAQERMSLQELSRSLAVEDEAHFGRFEISPKRESAAFGPFHTASFKVQLDAAGGVVRSMKPGNVIISDEDLIGAVQAAKAAGKSSGVLRDYQLRYLFSEDGLTLAFCDISGERAMQNRLLLLSGAAMLGALGAFFGVSLLLSNWALAPVERAWEQQRRFVADASHELKTPLTVILANTGILLSHPSDSIAQQQKWLISTNAEARRMKTLVDDMLYLSKSDSAIQQTLCAGEVNLSEVISGTLLAFEAVAFECGVTVSEDIDSACKLMGDEAQLKKLAGVLLDNAVKYAGENGSVHVSLKKQKSGCILSVSNTGAPIPPEDLPHVFERFYRADKSRSHATGGYGLGLGIAKSVADAQHARISVTSDAQNGTVFTVVFTK